MVRRNGVVTALTGFPVIQLNILHTAGFCTQFCKITMYRPNIIAYVTRVHILIFLNEGRSTLLTTVVGSTTSDDDTADTVLLSEVDGPPRMCHVALGTRPRKVVAINSGCCR